MTSGQRAILEALADPSRRAGLRPDERAAVRAALAEYDAFDAMLAGALPGQIRLSRDAVTLPAEIERLARERAEADHATIAARLECLRLVAGYEASRQAWRARPSPASRFHMHRCL